MVSVGFGVGRDLGGMGRVNRTQCTTSLRAAAQKSEFEIISTHEK